MKKLNEINILVVGDIMLDEYIVGKVERISPEAPVPIVNVENEYSVLGGCGNVVRNIRSMGSGAICATKTGTDEAADEIKRQLGILGTSMYISKDKNPTTVKTRIVAGEKETQLLRIDKEFTTTYISDKIVQDLSSITEDFDLIVISDYGKGYLSYAVMDRLIQFKKPIIIDPVPKNYKVYKNAFIITPNEKEFEQMARVDTFMHPIHSKCVLKTMGKKGMVLYENTPHPLPITIKAEPVDVYNVSGAGDTVVAVMSVCIALGATVLHAAKVANKCAGYVVTQTGTSSITREKFDRYLEEVLNE